MSKMDKRRAERAAAGVKNFKQWKAELRATQPNLSDAEVRATAFTLHRQGIREHNLSKQEAAAAARANDV